VKVLLACDWLYVMVFIARVVNNRRKRREQRTHIRHADMNERTYPISNSNSGPRCTPSAAHH